MKSMRIVIMAMLLTMGATANAQREVFDKYKDHEGVKMVHVPRFMMRIASFIDNDAKKLTDKVSDIRVLACDNKKLASKIKQDALAAYRNQGYEEMISLKEDEEQVRIYQRILKDGKSEYTLLAEADELAIINVTGRLSLDELKAIEDMFN